MRTALGLVLESIENAQDSLITARDAGQVPDALFDSVFGQLLSAKLDLMNGSGEKGVPR